MTRVLVERVRQACEAGVDPRRVLALAPDRRTAGNLARLLAGAGLGEVRPRGYTAFAQVLIEDHWPAAAARLGVDAPGPVFLTFDLAQYACREEYRRDPGNLARLTIREPRLIVQLLDNMNLAAANGLSLDGAWARVAAGLSLRPDDPVIEDGRRVTARFRARCLAAGVLPYDLQIETAAWLLGLPETRERLAHELDLLVVDGLDEIVPSVVRALGALAAAVPRAALGASSDGGLRWMLGASALAAEREARTLVASSGFRWARLAGAHPAGRRATAERIAHALADPEQEADHRPCPGWSIVESQRPDQMASAAVVRVLGLLDDGTAPEEIVLLTPYVDPVVAGELVRAFGDQEVPFRIEQRWRSLFDDPATRACVTALRLAAPEPGRRASVVELADLLATLLDANPVEAQRLANVVYDPDEGTLRRPAAIERRMADARFGPPPEPVVRLAAWVAGGAGDEALDTRLGRLAGVLLDLPPSPGRAALVDACRLLGVVAGRFIESAPRLDLAPPYLDDFLAFVDSDAIAADDPPEHEEPAVTLTTPYAFLTAGRSAAHQFWLDVASPQWWEPPLLLLTNPHALGDDLEALPYTLEHEEAVRARVLGRVVRNLAAGAGVAIHAMASHTGIDGEPLDGPLLDALRAAGVAEETR